MSNNSNLFMHGPIESQTMPTELQNLQLVLAHSQPLQQLIDTYVQQCKPSGNRRKLERFSNALKSERNLLAWTTDPFLASMLPTVIRFNRLPQLSADEIKNLTATLNSATKRKPLAWNLLVYPLFLTLVTLVFLILLGIFVIPVFGEMYRDFQLKLPVPTEILIRFSETLNRQPTMVAFAVLACGALAASMIALAGYLLEHLQIFTIVGMWTAGNRRNLESLSRWSNVLAELLDIGFELPQALKIAATASESPLLSNLSTKLANLVHNAGAPLSCALVQSTISGLPPTVVQALFGSTTPSIPLLRQIAQISRIRVEARVDRVGGFIGPLTVVFIGLIVGFIVLALFMPMVSLVTSLS